MRSLLSMFILELIGCFLLRFIDNAWLHKWNKCKMKCNDKFEYMWLALISLFRIYSWFWNFWIVSVLCLFRIYNLFSKKWGFEKLYIRILRLCFYFLLLLLFTVQSLVTFFHFIILGSYFQSTWIYALWIIINFAICYLIKIKILSKWKKGHHVFVCCFEQLALCVSYWCSFCYSFYFYF